MPYGAYVAMVWSDRLDGLPPGEIERMQAAKEAQYGITAKVVYGDDFRTLRDGTAAVVFDGGFSSPRDAAQWCRNRGVTDPQACIGVGLNDDYSQDDRNGTGRMYVNEL